MPEQSSFPPSFRRSITRDGLEHDLVRLTHESTLNDKLLPDLDSLQHIVHSLNKEIRQRDALILELQLKN